MADKANKKIEKTAQSDQNTENFETVKVDRPVSGSAGAQSSGERQDHELKHNKSAKKRKPIVIILDILIIACLIGALYFFLDPKIRNRKQNMIEQDAVQQINAALAEDHADEADASSSSDPENELKVSISVDPDALKVPGESYENFGGEAVEEEYVYDAEGNVIINFIGALVIPKIDLNTPIADDDSLVAIRYGVGHTPESDEIGKPGRALLFGHWFQEYGRVFNRLEEIKAGDEFYIDILKNRTRYYYKVHRAIAISHDDLPYHLFEEEPTVESEVVLITCIVRNNAWRAPTGRYLVYGELVDSKSIAPDGDNAEPNLEQQAE